MRLLDVGTGNLIFKERCTDDRSISVGGSGQSHKMQVDATTLGKIIQQYNSGSSLKFESTYGQIDILNFNQGSDMHLSTLPHVEILTQAQKNVTFISGKTSVSQLSVYSNGGIAINQDVRYFSIFT